jgi:hypothetical protein
LTLLLFIFVNFLAVYVTFPYFRARASFSLSFDAGPAKPAVPSSGGLKRHRSWWLENCSDKWVLQWVQHGFPLFWSFLPSPAPPFFQQNNKEALACSDFVTSSIFDLLRANAIMKWHTQPKCVSPLNVVTRSNDKQRLILDLRHVNQFLITLLSHGLSQSTD